jgi:hypothetical protein
MQAYKLFEINKSGQIFPLFVGKSALPMGEWLVARDLSSEATRKGLASRPGWHCCSKQSAPHLKLEPKNGRKRRWALVEIEDWTEHLRPESQGGLWYTASRMKIINLLDTSPDPQTT